MFFESFFICNSHSRVPHERLILYFYRPQRGNFGGKKRNDWTPYKKPQNNTPGKQAPNEDKKSEVPLTPETNDKNLKTTPTPVKAGESNGPQVQNIKRELPGSPAVVKPEEIVNVPQDDKTKDDAAETKTLPDGIQETVNRVKYMGRDGEKKFSGRCRLFVANLNNSTTEEELRELFGQFGETGEVFVNKDKGFGFIRLVSYLFKIFLKIKLLVSFEEEILKFSNSRTCV